MAQPAAAKARALPESPTVKLAKFFPEAMPVRIPVRLTRLAADNEVSESTTIEFATTREALLASKLPLEFADRLRLQNSDGTLNVEACVVAVQYNTGKTAVAARFNQDIPNWIVKS
jgi:hypothetical protein